MSEKSNGIKVTKAGSGQRMNSAYPADNAGSHSVPNSMGGSMGGSTSNLGHSLKGASAVLEPNKSGKGGGI